MGTVTGVEAAGDGEKIPVIHDTTEGMRKAVRRWSISAPEACGIET